MNGKSGGASFGLVEGTAAESSWIYGFLPDPKPARILETVVRRRLEASGK